ASPRRILFVADNGTDDSAPVFVERGDAYGSRRDKQRSAASIPSTARRPGPRGKARARSAEKEGAVRGADRAGNRQAPGHAAQKRYDHPNPLQTSLQLSLQMRLTRN